MGRGLSEQQTCVLDAIDRLKTDVMVGRKRYLSLTMLRHDLFGWPLKQKGPYVGDRLREIGYAEYNLRMVSLTRSLQRLVARGLVEVVKTGLTYGHGYQWASAIRRSKPK